MMTEGSAAGELAPLSDAEFALFQELVYREAGIYLSDAKKALVFGRLARRVRQLGLSSFREYYRYIMKNGEAERVHMLDCISTNETHFFREPMHFELLQQQIFPRWLKEGELGLRPKRVRIWSAGCSSGEEPYSVAMALLGNTAFRDWDVQIIATDISTRMLERAQAGVWPIQKSHEIPPPLLKQFMLKGMETEAGKMKAGPEIRSLIRFLRVNFNESPYPVVGPFDLIFCRNVLIYFDHAMKQRVVNCLLNYLAPTGYFFVGHAENLNLVTDRVSSIIPTVYVQRRATNSREQLAPRDLGDTNARRALPR